ncbi:rhomboid family intramembrane serine protease [Fulvitalea axinellae]
MKVTYNSPVVLTFTFASALVLILNEVTAGAMTPYFSVGGTMNWASPLDYFRLFSHVLGHADWAHLFGNFTFILLIGPILEEKYGGGKLLGMILVTALVTGLCNVFFFSNGLLGASGIVFMMILLGSIVNAERGTIPLTFILVAVLFLGKEIADIFRDDQVSQAAHIIGGICGAAFGFFLIGEKKKPGAGSTASTEDTTASDDFPGLSDLE